LFVTVNSWSKFYQLHFESLKECPGTLLLANSFDIAHCTVSICNNRYVIATSDHQGQYFVQHRKECILKNRVMGTGLFSFYSCFSRAHACWKRLSLNVVSRSDRGERTLCKMPFVSVFVN
jgi:hypothetical protein